MMAALPGQEIHMLGNGNFGIAQFDGFFAKSSAFDLAIKAKTRVDMKIVHNHAKMAAPKAPLISGSKGTWISKCKSS